jgi:6-phosphogluconolactonase
METADQKTFNLLVGGYTDGSNKGISVYRFNAETGDITYLSAITGIANPSYLCLAGNGRFVYAVNENSPEEPGGVSAFSFEPETGKLQLINRQVTDAAPCYVSVDTALKHAFVANYAGGVLTVFPISDDGALLPVVQTVRHEGSGPDEDRQEKPHVHAAVLSPDENHLLFTDLGTDRVFIYQNKPNHQPPLHPADPSFISVMPGHGPRHIAFTPDGRFMYLITEMGGVIYAYACNDLPPSHLQTISLAADGFKGEMGGSDLQISPDGRFLYAANRGDANEIVVFSVNAETGQLSFVERKPSMGESPRYLALDPTGNYLLVANQNSHNIYVYRIDQQTGKLTPTDSKIDIDSPSCLKFATINKNPEH